MTSIPASESSNPKGRSSAHADESTHGSDGAQVVSVRLVGMDKPFFVAIAVAISIMSAFYAFESGRETAQAVYWLQRNEAFLEQLSAQGVHVPSDLLIHKGKSP